MVLPVVARVAVGTGGRAVAARGGAAAAGRTAGAGGKAAGFMRGQSLLSKMANMIGLGMLFGGKKKEDESEHAAPTINVNNTVINNHYQNQNQYDDRL